MTVVLAVWFSRAAAEPVTVSGTNQLQDVYLRGDNNAGGTTPVNNYGGSTLLMVGRIADGTGYQNLAHTLLRFDLSGLSGQTVTQATLRLYNNNNAQQTSDVTVSAYEAVAANGDWVEGAANGAVVTGTSDWRFKIQNTGVWAGGQNGCGVAGTDYTTNRVGSATVADGAAGYVDIALDAAVVTKWIDHPEQNYGIILTVPEAVPGQVVYFNSSEAASNVPALMLETAAKATLRLVVITGPAS
jgi:heat shock protein HslJ